jgi:4-diphosphocytidyl-2-C-methyl-D-erythritol kinase
MARMSGSGATCFALFASAAAAQQAAKALRGNFPNWWIRRTML